MKLLLLMSVAVLTVNAFPRGSIGYNASEALSLIVCVQLKEFYRTKGLPESEPSIGALGNYSNSCHPGYTCCTKKMTDSLTEKISLDLEQKIKLEAELISDQITARLLEFQEYLRLLIDNASQAFDRMFTIMFGITYKSNSDIYTDLFEQLKLYYGDDELTTDAILDDFFSKLMPNLYSQMNPSHVISKRYRKCMIDNIKKVKPFNEIPGRYAKKVRKAFLPAKVFIEALETGQQVTRNLSLMHLQPECAQALMKMSSCSTCSGFLGLKPCRRLCINVLKGCLTMHGGVDVAWNNYIDSLATIIGRLEVSSLKSVLDEMPSDISSAIMAFQEGNRRITNTVTRRCGRMTRGKRDLHNSSGVDALGDSFPNEARRRSRKDEPNIENARDPLLSPTQKTLAKAEEKKLQPFLGSMWMTIGLSVQFWTNLPYVLCNDLSVREYEAQCWNGTTRGKYITPLVGNGFQNQLNNPEVAVSVPPTPDPRIEQQVEAMEMIVNKVKKMMTDE